MIVLVLEHVTPGLRGELSRWFLEPRAGVFVGNVSGMVREKIWEKICSDSREGSCIMFYSMNTEQGYLIKTWGLPSREVKDFDGLLLIKST